MDQKELVSEEKLNQIIESLAVKITDKMTANTVFVGLDLRGKILANRLANYCQKIIQRTISTGTIDTSLYRDLSDKSYINIGETNIQFCLKNKHVILVIECLKSGTAINAALNALSDFNQPSRIDVACLVDQDILIYPILAKFVGLKLPFTEYGELNVKFIEIDGQESVVEKYVLESV